MKKSRIAIILLSLLLVFSCSTGKPATAELTISTDSTTPVTYVVRTSAGDTRTATVTSQSPRVERDLPVGDASIVYYGLDVDARRVAVASIGKDDEVVLSMKESVPERIYTSIPSLGSKRDLDASVSCGYSFFILNENGTGWKTSIDFDAALHSDSAKLVSTVSIGWKIDGNSMLISEDGKTPSRFTMSGDVLINGSLRWEKAPAGDVGDSIDGTWNLIGIKPIEDGLPSPAIMQLSIAGNGKDVRLLASLDASGIPSDHISSSARSDVEMDISKLAATDAIDFRLSSDGGIAIASIGRMRIPFTRAGNLQVKIWDGTEAAKDRMLSMNDVLTFIDSTPVVVNGKEVYVKDILAKADTVVTASGKTADISGVWTVGDDEWTTDYCISVSDKGRTVIHVPSRSGFHAFEIEKAAEGKMSLQYRGYYLVELDGVKLEYSGKAVGTAVKKDDVEKSVVKTFDALVGKLFGSEEVTAEKFRIGIKDGHFQIVMPDLSASGKEISINLASATVKDGEIGFKVSFDGATMNRIIEEFGISGIEILDTAPSVTLDAVFPLSHEGKVVLCRIGETEIVF